MSGSRPFDVHRIYKGAVPVRQPGVTSLRCAEKVHSRREVSEPVQAICQGKKDASGGYSLKTGKFVTEKVKQKLGTNHSFHDLIQILI